VETGKYTGTIVPGSVVDVQILAGSNIVLAKDTVNTILSGNDVFVQAWTHHFLSDLIGAKNMAYFQEVVDSSKSNRVLCEYTAFLAVENGDTISSNVTDNPNVTLGHTNDL